MIKKTTNWVPFFDAVDEVRRTKRLTALRTPLNKAKNKKEKALILATAKFLANEIKVNLPNWASEHICLKYPYFVSGVESLKPMALIESPAEYKICNIFVLDNFLNRI